MVGGRLIVAASEPSRLRHAMGQCCVLNVRSIQKTNHWLMMMAKHEQIGKNPQYAGAGNLSEIFFLSFFFCEGAVAVLF